MQNVTTAPSTCRTGEALAWLPEVGDALDVLALGRSGDLICGRMAVGPFRVLIRTVPSCPRLVAGELFTIDVSRRSRDRHFWLLEGTVHSARFEVDALGVEPLALRPRAVVGESNGESELQYELARVIPTVPGLPAGGEGTIREIVAFWKTGDREIVEVLAGELLARDLRCLEAHALLGDLDREGPLEERWTERALRHYRVGAAIGGLSLDEPFAGILPRRWPGNRAYLRCLYWQARCLERIGDAGSAQESFRLLERLAPEDSAEIGPVAND